MTFLHLSLKLISFEGLSHLAVACRLHGQAPISFGEFLRNLSFFIALVYTLLYVYCNLVYTKLQLNNLKW